MKYKGQKISEEAVKDSISGLKMDKYECYFFDTRYLKDLTDLKQVICVSANSIPISKGNVITSFERKYVAIEYFEDFEDYKQMDFGAFMPMSVFVIKCKGKDKNGIEEIITDIKTKHNMGYNL